MLIKKVHLSWSPIVALLIFPLVAPADSKYPWLDQISRQEQLLMGCENMGLKYKKKVTVNMLNHILVDHHHKLLYCYVPKVACTNWKRVLMVLTGESNATNPIQISASTAHLDNSTLKLSQLTVPEIRESLRQYTLFLVARHPFERLLSAYRNKFLGNNTISNYFKNRYGKYIIQKYRKKSMFADSGSDFVTFREFIQYLIKEGVRSNEHWTPIYDLCLPCSLDYNFISRYETIPDDASTILNMVNAPSLVFPATRSGRTKDNLRFYFQQLSIYEIEALYKLYEADFKLFGYGLEEMLGYDLA
ncbi:unnamed protein product [Phyllotreta striolata]|uniref:Carbohydrate sulfotransferase n=1 Tax=Phyllotreta striolata TaxID=444603 RepID=A0A9N9XQS0_PHYSR|nr:unnamed protein product [Phyllotreta striolata]